MHQCETTQQPLPSSYPQKDQQHYTGQALCWFTVTVFPHMATSLTRYMAGFSIFKFSCFQTSIHRSRFNDTKANSTMHKHGFITTSSFVHNMTCTTTLHFATVAPHSSRIVITFSTRKKAFPIVDNMPSRLFHICPSDHTLFQPGSSFNATFAHQFRSSAAAWSEYQLPLCKWKCNRPHHVRPNCCFDIAS